LGNFKYFESDLWLNWEKFILPGDSFQEEFTLASTVKIKLYEPENKLRVSIPLQGMATHKGGQNIRNSQHLQTFFNTASGIELNYFPEAIAGHTGKNSENHFGTSHYFVSYYDASQFHIQYYSQGCVMFSNIYVKLRKFDFMAGYWYSKHFIAPCGEVLFQSVSQKYVYWWEPEKQLVTGKIQFQQKIYNGINLAVRAETYYDLLRYNFDFSYSFYLVIRQEFFLKKIGKNYGGF